jgi:hypothetical protein
MPGSGGLLPPSPPTEKATARKDQTWQSSAHDGARDRSSRNGHLNTVNEARASLEHLYATAAATSMGCTGQLRHGQPMSLHPPPAPPASGTMTITTRSLTALWAFYTLKRAKYLVCNITDATPKEIAMARVRANIAIHICSSIAWQAGARPVSQPPAPGHRAAAGDSPSVRLLPETSETFFAIGKRAALTMRPHHEGIRSAGGNALAADAGLWAARGPHADTRL